MTAGDARHGRRDNGLVAAEYVAAGDVDPRVGEHLLDVLALRGIAAYLRPSTDLHPVTRANSLPDRPTDRLYVDRDHVATARDFLTQLGADGDGLAGGSPEPGARAAGSGPQDADQIRQGDGSGTANLPEVDRAWAAIVADFDREVDPPQRDWPPAEDVTGSGDVTGNVTDALPDKTAPGVGPNSGVSRAPARLPRSDDAEASLLDGLDTFGANLPDDGEGFTPPPPPPLPRPTLPAVLGVLGVVGGLIVFLNPELLPIDHDTALMLGFLAIITGFITLVWRLRPGDDDDIDPDDGARV